MKGASVFDRDDPDSVINRTQGELRAAIERAEQSKEARKIQGFHPRALKDNIKPDPRDNRLRISFWDEYSRAVERDHLMRIDQIYAGVTTYEVFRDDYLSDPRLVGFLLNIPFSYMKNAEEILLSGLDRLRDIIDLPLVNSKGQVQPAVANAIIKAVEMLDKRVKGAVMQKVAVHQHHTQGAPPIGFEAGGSLAINELEMLEKQLLDVRKRMNEKYALIDNTNNKEILVEKAQDDEEA